MTSSTVEQPRRLYEVIEERNLVGDKQLPTKDVLDEVVSALSAVDEFLINPIKMAVAAVGSIGAPGSITFEDIGRLILWADQVRNVASAVEAAAATVAIVAHESYEVAEGFRGNLEEVFSSDGYVVDREQFKRFRQRYGFDA